MIDYVFEEGYRILNVSHTDTPAGMITIKGIRDEQTKQGPEHRLRIRMIDFFRPVK